MNQRFVIASSDDDFELPNTENYKLGDKNISIIEVDQNSELITPLQKLAFERIFVKDQTLDPKEQNYIEPTNDKQRFVSYLRLNEDAESLQKYKDIHGKGQVWPQIIENMESLGVIDMELYVDGYDAYMIMDTKPDFDAEKANAIWPNLPLEKEWQAYVSEFQKTSSEANASEKWQNMDLIN